MPDFAAFLRKAKELIEPVDEPASSKRRPFADRATPDGTAGVSGVALIKKGEPASELVAEISVRFAEKTSVERRRAPSYVWRSQASGEKRAAWADMPERF